ncbi:MAG: TetR/AcrR family transcriptional regulator [Burkholderiaceae bacterium]
MTVDAIFEAGIQVLLHAGTERFTTTRVAERAGVSVGTLYQYFPNKQALLLALLERHLVHVLDAVEAACGKVRGQSLASMAKALVDSFVDAKMERPEVSLALYPVALDTAGAAIVTRLTQKSQLALCELLASAPESIADLRLTSFVLSTALVGPVQATLAEGAPPAMVAAVRQQLVAMVTGYLEQVATKRS